MCDLLFCAHTLYMNDMAKTFPNCLVSQSEEDSLRCAQLRPKKQTKTYNKELCQAPSPFPSTDFEQTCPGCFL